MAKILMRLTKDYHDFGDSDEIAACPFCGMTDKLTITSRKSFDEMLIEKGSAIISINCKRCNLDLYEHSYSGKNFALRAMILLDKWNRRNEDDTKED